jgi:nucleotide-binding universal stress UspA family protein
MLVTALHTPFKNGSAPSTAQFDLIDVMKDLSNEGLNKLVQKINTQYSNPQHTFSKIASFNTLTNEINELYEGNLMELIIMGTKGATGAKEILFGSNTVHIIKNAKCPVLAIPSDFSFETPYEILFPSDYEVKFHDKHLQPIKDITSLYNTRINILHVSHGSELTELQKENKQKLDTYFKKQAHLFHDVKNKNVPQAISEFQLKSRVNLLVMLNNKHSFFENLFFKSTINQIGFHLNIPLLVIPSR